VHVLCRQSGECDDQRCLEDEAVQSDREPPSVKSAAYVFRVEKGAPTPNRTPFALLVHPAWLTLLPIILEEQIPTQR
jgi:hypothetical protein